MPATTSTATPLDQIERSGIVGAGGAGFPTHVKLKANADTVILNAAECEPLLHKDKELLRHYARPVLDGLETARQLVGAREAVIGVKGKYHDVIDQLRGMLPPNMRIAELTDSYPAGDEFILVYDVTGRIIPPAKSHSPSAASSSTSKPPSTSAPGFPSPKSSSPSPAQSTTPSPSAFPSAHPSANSSNWPAVQPPTTPSPSSAAP